MRLGSVPGNHRGNAVIHAKNALMCVLAAAAIGAASLASAQATDGGIAGTAMAGETIVIKGDNGVQREIQIDKSGKFSVRHLPIGSYHVIWIGADGSVIKTQAADVMVGKTARLM